MNYSIIGGDLRLIKLALMLTEDENTVYVYGMEKSNEINEKQDIIKCKSLSDALESSDIIIGSIPFSKSDGETYAVFSEKHIKIEDIIRKKYQGKTFIAGSIKPKDRELLQTSFSKVIDIMEKEELIILNTIATAEGALDVAIRNTDTIIQGSKVLVLGFGRVAKIVAEKFRSLEAKVTCAARKDEDLAWMKVMGYEAININNLNEDIKKFDIIINTVPHMIVDKKEMQYMNPNVLLIDLASSPGGINTEDANKMNLKFVWALALPGKVAPITSAEFIKDTIYDEVKKNI